MKQLKNILKISIAAAMLSGLFSVCAAADEGNWAIYMYVCGSDLESGSGYATDNLLDLMHSERTEDTIIVAQTGGASEWHNNFVDAEKTQRWLYVDGDMELVDEQECLNMGDADTLADFLAFASTNYPADHTMVIFWDHGGGTLSGCCIDENFDNDSLSLTEMHDAFSRVYDLSGEALPVDIIGFDCCLMATIDVADTFKDVAHYLVASEEVEPCDGWNYDYLGGLLGENPSIDPMDLGVEICSSYYDRLVQIDEELYTSKADTATLSLTDLTQVDNLTAAFDSFIDNMIVTAYYDPEYFRAYSMFAQNSENYGGNSRSEGYMDLTDIKDFILNSGEYIQGSEEVLNALDACVLYQVNGGFRTRGGGLSFYFDYDGQKEKNDQYDENGSLDALKVLYDFGLSDGIEVSSYDYMQQLGLDTGAIPEVSSLEYTESNVTPIQFNEEGIPFVDFGEELASCITDAMYYVYYVEDGKSYYIGSDDEVACDFEAGTVADRMGGNWAYFDGNLASMELVYDNADYHLYAIPVKVGEEELCLQVGFDTAENKWTVLGAGIPHEETAMTSRAIYLEKGTEVTLLYKEVRADGELITVEGNSFIYDPDSSFSFEPLVNGRYAIQYVIEDMYANTVSSEYIVFDLADGERTFDATAAIPFSEVPENPTAEEAAQDGEQHVANLTIINNTDSDIVEFSVAASEDELTDENILVASIGAGVSTNPGDYTMGYHSNSLLWVIRAVDASGTEHTFDWDLSNCDAEEMSVEFFIDTDGLWTIRY